MRARTSVIWIIALSAFLLVGLYFALQVEPRKPSAQNSQLRTYTLSISNSQASDVFPTFKANEGDRVTFTIHSDRRGQVNVHGYEKQVAVAPDGEASLTLTANAAGVFPIHLHELANPSNVNGEVMHRHLATLEVRSP
jgi:hypothetical protein